MRRVTATRAASGVAALVLTGVGTAGKPVVSASLSACVDQQGAIALFESLGFRAEALLKDHVRDQAGKTHDLAILAQDVARIGSGARA